MLIDWFTVGAQILNFLILLFLLKIFLYDKIVAAMKKREQDISDRLQAAQDERKEAEAEKQRLQARQQELEDEREAILRQAREDAEERRKSLMDEIREEVDARRSQQREALDREQDAFLRELKSMAARQVAQICRKVLGDLADASLEDQLAAVFVEKLDSIETDEASRLAEAAREKGFTVRSALPLDEGPRDRITQAVHKTLLDAAEIEYRHDPEMVLGIEIRSKGVKLDWSIDGYLKDMQEKVEAFLSSAGSTAQNAPSKQTTDAASGDTQ